MAMNRSRIPKRRYRDEVKLSILGLGGMLLVDLERKAANSIVAEAFEQGINYFDVAPFYGDGEAEESMGTALEPYRNRVFLACKTLERSAGSVLIGQVPHADAGAIRKECDRQRQKGAAATSK